MKTPNGGRKGSGLKMPSVPGIKTPKAVNPTGNGSAPLKTGGTMDWFKGHLKGQS